MGLPDARPPAAVRAEGLSKEFRFGLFRKTRRAALKNVGFEIQRGEIFGYLGPNGSGKTTTLKIIFGLLFPDSGSLTLLGHAHSDRTWRYKAGYLPEHPYFYDYLSPSEYLDYAGRLVGMTAGDRRDRSETLLARVKLSHVADVPLRRFSKGMLQRLGIAQALIHDPELVFLDEPMSGLDPIGRRLVRDLIFELKQQGKTIFFSTHILSDAETLCDRVALLRDGELLRTGTLADILKVDVSHMEVLVSGIAAEAMEALPAKVKMRHALGERWRLEVEEGVLAETVTAVNRAGGRILAIQAVRESLEDYFMREIGAVEARKDRWIFAD
jgi:ABC-2 type transport system ATP-binding protein